ncbi:MAG: DUF3139 domain-containing protein [Treponema sp.]
MKGEKIVIPVLRTIGIVLKKISQILLLVICLVIIYQFPIQKRLALNKFERYIKKQGVDPSKITEREVSKNWKSGGYTIQVKFEDDADKTYYYHYEELKLDRMWLTVTNRHNQQLEAPLKKKCKYPPIEDD